MEFPKSQRSRREKCDSGDIGKDFSSEPFAPVFVTNIVETNSESQDGPLNYLQAHLARKAMLPFCTVVASSVGNRLAVLHTTQCRTPSLGLDGIMGADCKNERSFAFVGFFCLQAFVSRATPDKLLMQTYYVENRRAVLRFDMK
jgi:hypothetical protein